MKLQKKTAAKAPQSPAGTAAALPLAPAAPPPAPLSREVLAPFSADAEAWIRNVMEEFAATAFPELGTKWLARIYTATSLVEAEKLATKAKTFGHLELINDWRNHRIRGPLGAGGAVALKSAKKADGLADMLEGKGEYDQAEAQRARAERIRLDIKACSKCGTTSGNSWSQCQGVCPMPMSPHYVAP